MKRLLFAFFVLVLSVNAFATYVAVLETAADGSAKDSVSLLDRQYLTNVLREQAVKELPATEDFTIMTRENILQMLPPGKAIEDCEGSCLVETGKNIAADYICQARVGRFGASLTLSAELYETAGNKLIASFNGRGQNVEELLAFVESKSHDFFGMIRKVTRPAETGDKVAENKSVENKAVENKAVENNVGSEKADVVKVERGIGDKDSKVGESIPANVDASAASAKKRGVHWVPLSISAAATVTGVVLAVVGNSKAKSESEKKPASQDEYNKRHDDIGTYQTMRAVGIGIAIAGAVGVGLSFAF
ncbi:MAG: hypothetical protein IKS96_05125 [Fibrobacter sp.]|nr:hypothetical protein [Fibrobacter sp.]